MTKPMNITSLSTLHRSPPVHCAPSTCTISIVTSFLFANRFTFTRAHLAVGLGLLPLHLIELGLESLVLIGLHLQPVLQGRALLLVPANQLAVDLVLESSEVKEKGFCFHTGGAPGKKDGRKKKKNRKQKKMMSLL